MSDVTRILSAIEQGNPRAAERLLPLVYDELRKLAAQRLALEKPGQTLQATALVHEAYVRLVPSPLHGVRCRVPGTPRAVCPSCCVTVAEPRKPSMRYIPAQGEGGNPALPQVYTGGICCA